MKQIYDDKIPKFILVFRNPVERAFSHYLHRVRNHMEMETFERALELEEERLSRDPDLWVGYFRDGLYAQQLSEWLEAFPRDNFLFLLTEDLKNDPLETARKVFEFLGVAQDVEVDVSARRNVASEPRWPWLTRFLATPSLLKRPISVLLPPYVKRRIRWFLLLGRFNLKPVAQKPKLNSRTAAMLREAYRDDVQKLARIIRRDLTHWLES